MADIKDIVSGWLNGTQQVTGGATSRPEGEIVQAEESLSDAQDDYGISSRDSESTTGELDLGGNSEDQNSTDRSATRGGKSNAKDAQSKQAVPGDRETITITDDKGRRRVEVDYTDRAAIKKAFEFQYGARKWQAERDKALESSKQTSQELARVQKDWDALDKAYRQGPEHLFDLLQGSKGAFQDHVRKQMERDEYLRSASPAEIQALQAQELADARSRELQAIREENEQFRRQVSTEREQAEERALESRIHPAFTKYRFAETLGNPDDEHMFDSMLWSTALERLVPYEQQGLDITPELVEREFRSVAQSIRRRIGAQAEKKATQVVAQRKREATENVQSRVKSGYDRGSSTATEARDLMRKGDLTSLLKGWGKYGGLFGGK